MTDENKNILLSAILFLNNIIKITDGVDNTQVF